MTATRASLMLAAALLLPAGAAQAQVPTPPAKASLVFAPDAERQGPAALVWLREDYLPHHAQWPNDLAALGAFQLELDADGLRCLPFTGVLPDCYLAGSFELPRCGAVLVHCRRDGTEEWFTSGRRAPGGRPGQLLAMLAPEAEHLPRTIDVATACGVLAADLLHEDPRSELLTVAASRCGEVSWTVAPDGDGLHVRGRSGGGLVLPACLLWLATVDRVERIERWLAPMPADDVARWSLRAFAGRDGDRAEAARQLGRATTTQAQATLRAMMYAEEPGRVAAMLSLAQTGGYAGVQRMLRAADPELPGTVATAADAVRASWPNLQPGQRGELLHELRGHRADAMHALADELALDPRPRLLLILAITAAGLAGFWLRARRRPPTVAA